MKNKRGQDLSIGTLILIVLGIVVLVLLILGFSLGWNNLWEKINIFGGGSSVGNLVTACQVKVTSNNKFGYCKEFTLVSTTDGKKEYLNCQDSRVSGSLEETLDCDETDATKAGQEYCTTLAKSNSIKSDTKVNGVTCATLSCENLGGVDAEEGETNAEKCPQETPKASAGKPNPIEIAKDKVCCFA